MAEGYPKVSSSAWRTLRSRAASAPSTRFTPSTVAAMLDLANPESARTNIVGPLIARGLIHPTLSRVHPLEQAGQAAYDVQHNLHQGKVGVLALAPEEGLGVRDHAMRERLLPQLMRFRDV